MFDRRPQYSAMHIAIAFMVFMASGFVDRANADVVTIGAVSPTPPVNGGTFSGELIVGDGTDEESNDIWGIVSVDDGTFLQYGQLIIGNESGYFGQVDVTGTSSPSINTQFNLSDSGGTSNPTVQVGFEGTGWLNVTNSAKMTLTNNGGNVSLGTRSTGIGYATVADPFTFLTLSDSLFVGQSGTGDLQVVNGALLRLNNFSSSRVLSIGTNAGSYGSMLVDGSRSQVLSSANLRVGDAGQGYLTIRNGALVNVNVTGNPVLGSRPSINIGTNLTGGGTVVVDGAGSRLQTHNSLVVGDLGVGSLSIDNGAVVSLVDKAAESVFVGPFGRIELHGGSLLGSTPPGLLFGTNVEGYLGGSGLVQGSVFLDETARMEVQSDDRLQFHGDVSNQGAVNVSGGVAEFFGDFTNNATGGFSTFGRFALENGGTAIFTQPLTNDGVISNAHGTTNVYGRITNNGDIVVARDTVATFYDPVTNLGTITVLPGGNALFLADLTFTSAGAGAGAFDAGSSGSAAGGMAGAATLVLGLDPENPGGASGHVNVNGVATLAGTLVLSLEGGFSSLVGQTLNLVTATSVVGAFDSVLLPPVPNDLDVGLVYTPTGVSMQISSIADGIPGDYNQDGIVNAADYTVWRDNYGSANSLPNDDTPGVGDDDYARWKANFGQEAIVGSGAISSPVGAIPEPTAATLAFAALFLALALGRRQII